MIHGLHTLGNSPFCYRKSGRPLRVLPVPGDRFFVAFEIDHIISLKHGGTDVEDNLALSCTICNKNKGSDIASLDHETGNIVALYHPRKDSWTDHFRLLEGRIVPLTPVGRVTVRLLQLNAMNRVEERKLLEMSGLIELVIRY